MCTKASIGIEALAKWDFVMQKYKNKKNKIKLYENKATILFMQDTSTKSI